MSLVERYARALGVWRDGDGDAVFDLKESPWAVQLADGHAFITHRNMEQTWRVDEPTALLFEHTLAPGETLDVGLCGVCKGTKLELRSVRIMGPNIGSLLEDEGWERTCEPYDTGRGAIPWALDLSRPCPTCTTDGKPTGRDVRTLARLMVEAMPRPPTDDARREHAIAARVVAPRRLRPPQGTPGNPAAREHLATAADQLQDRGDPLGTWLALWLEGECPTCEGRGWSFRPDLAAEPDRRPKSVELHGVHDVRLGSFVDIFEDRYRVRMVEVGCDVGTLNTVVPVEPPVRVLPIEPKWTRLHIDLFSRSQDDGEALNVTPKCPDCHGTGQALGSEQGAMEAHAWLRVPWPSQLGHPPTERLPQ